MELLEYFAILSDSLLKPMVAGFVPYALQSRWHSPCDNCGKLLNNNKACFELLIKNLWHNGRSTLWVLHLLLEQILTCLESAMY